MFELFLNRFVSYFAVGRWSQETGSDNEVHPHKISSPNPLPHPDLTENTYRQQGKMNMPPSLLENIQESYNMHPAIAAEIPYDNDRYKYNMDTDNVYGQNKDYQANYGDYPSPATYLSPNLNYTTSPGDMEYPNTQIINQMMPSTTNTNHYLHDLHDKQRTPYMGSTTELSYMSKERLTPSLYNTAPRESHYGLKSPAMYSGAESVHSVHSMLKNDYQVCVFMYWISIVIC